MKITINRSTDSTGSTTTNITSNIDEFNKVLG